jgi:thioredoxin-like negative regulator of GroEL
MKCQSVFRGVSPFPIAQLEFLRGHMWHEHHDLPRARHWLTSAWLRLPSYTQAEGHLAEVEFAMGEREEATTRLRGLASLSEDPDYAAQLARRLGDAGHHEDAAAWRDRAAAGFDKLIASHPAAFADHAAEFWLTVGGDPERAHSLAELNVHNRRTPQAHALLERTVHACSQRPS